jgi:hypothetical protein
MLLFFLYATNINYQKIVEKDFIYYYIIAIKWGESTRCETTRYLYLYQSTLTMIHYWHMVNRNARHFGTGTIRHQDTSAPVRDILVPSQFGTCVRHFGTRTIRHLCFFLWFYLQNFQ